MPCALFLATLPVSSTSIEIEYASAEGIEKTFGSSLKHRWSQLPDAKSPIKGIREFYDFVLMDENTISRKLVSSATDSSQFKLVDTVQHGKIGSKCPKNEKHLIIFYLVFGNRTCFIEYFTDF